MSGARQPAVLVVAVIGPVEVVVGPLPEVPFDLALVDALARVHLTTRRLGCPVRLRNPCPELLELLDLVGLADLLTRPPDPLPLEAGGEAEVREPLGVQETVEPGDPSV